MKKLYLFSRIGLPLLILILNSTITSCGQKGDLVRPSIEEEKPSQVEESKLL